MKNMLAVFAFVLVLFAGITYAQIPPPLPDKFYGTVKIDGNNVSAGTQITITVAGIIDSVYNMTQDGYYITNVKKGIAGEEIRFLIGGNVFGIATRDRGATINYDLQYTSPVTPPSEPSQPSGGGGGGGSSAPPENIINATTTCTPSWSCTDWTSCSNKIQTRTCTDKNNCGISAGMPETRRDCAKLTLPGEQEEGESSTPTGLLTSATAQAGIVAAVLASFAAVAWYVKKRYMAGKFGK